MQMKCFIDDVLGITEQLYEWMAVGGAPVATGAMLGSFMGVDR